MKDCPLAVVFRGFEVLLLALIVWATATEGPSILGTIYLLFCVGVVEASWRIVRASCSLLDLPLDEVERRWEAENAERHQ